MERDGLETASPQQVAEWIAEVNASETADQPLRWVDGRYHSAASLAHVWREENGGEMSPCQMAAALREIRDNPDDYEVTVEYEHSAKQNKGRWQVYKGVFANVA